MASEGHVPNAATAPEVQGRQGAGRTVNRKIIGSMLSGRTGPGRAGSGLTGFGLVRILTITERYGVGEGYFLELLCEMCASDRTDGAREAGC